jgi:hypothetical protein
MDEHKALAKLLRRLAECIEGSSANDVDDLLAGRRELRIFTGIRSTARYPKSQGAQSRDWSVIVERLRALRTRDEGQKLLDELNLTKTELERLARFMDLPVAKQDNAERLRQKVIEASIGSRLISQAIRGEQL